MKRNFLGAFWALLAVGICQLAIAVWLTQIYLQYFSRLSGRDVFSRVSIPALFFFPTLVLLEAAIYWLIRRRNKYYALSWAHSGIIAAAFLFNVVWSFVLRTWRYGPLSTESRIHWAILARQQRYLFWGLVAVAHLAFFAVLANCARKETSAPAREGGENLLDDVEL